MAALEAPFPPRPRPVPLLVPWPTLGLGTPCAHEDGLRVAGFLKVRNEIIREGNLFRVLDTLDRTCDSGIICDDASTDGTADYLRSWMEVRPSWKLIGVPPEQQDFRNELRVKQSMLEVLHATKQPPDWIFWLDGDELLEDNRIDDFRPWLRAHGDEADIWGFPYVQLWRSAGWERTDSGFADAQFWKLWRYQPDLSFPINDRLHQPQFPTSYVDMAVTAAGTSVGRARRAPFEIVHLGNYGKNLVLKAVQYRNSGELEQLSLKRHLYFDSGATYGRVDLTTLPPDMVTHASTLSPVPFTAQEITLIERMGDLRNKKGLCVVVVPTFNRGYALRRTIESVRGQTYQNWVCLVLDDGSTDNTSSLMTELQDSDPRIFYCRYPNNRGGVAMNEIGMALACDMGEFWMRLGSDDYWEPHKLELDVVAFREAPMSGACYGPYRDLHESGPGADLRNTPSDARGALLSKGFAASWANIAVRTSALRAVRDRYGAFCDPRIRNMEDWLVNTRIATMFEFAWRGMLRSGEIIVGAQSMREAGGQQAEMLFDAVWRIGADGASQNGKQCEIDARLTGELLDVDLMGATPRKPGEVRRMPYKLRTTTGFAVA